MKKGDTLRALASGLEDLAVLIKKIAATMRTEALLRDLDK